MVGMSQRDHMQTVRDVAHLNAFSHAMVARDGRRNRPVSLHDFGLAGLGDDAGDSGSSFTWDTATDLLTSATQGTAAIISALNQQPTTVIAGGSAVPYGYQTPRAGINPATGLPYPTVPSSSVSGNSMMTYLFLGGIALVAVMVLSKKKKSEPSSS